MPGAPNGRSASHARSILLPVLALLLTLAACRQAPDPQPSGPIIPESTRVLDAGTAASLTDFDPASGQLTFASDSPFLQELRLDDVLVSAPADAAPHGLLRQVLSVDRQGDQVIVQTAQASLLDAVHQGGFEASGTFDENDMLEPQLHAAGVTVHATPIAGIPALAARMEDGDFTTFGDAQPQQSIGEGYNFHVGLNEVLVDLDIEGVKVRVTVDGTIHFNAGYQAGLSIDPCFDLPPVCLEKFEASVGIEQVASIRVTGEAVAALNIEKLVATIPFSPLVFMIGPVPVVLVPSVDVYVGGSGEVRLSFSYGVTERFAALVGSRWTDSRGWEDITDFGLSIDGYDQFDINATFRASVYVRPQAKMLLYGLIGPAFSITAGVDLTAQVPGDPAWQVRAFLVGDVVFEVSLPVIGPLSSHRARLFDFNTDGRRSENSAPTVTINQGFLRVPLRTSAPLRSSYTVFDREQGSDVGFTIRSSMPGDNIMPRANHTFTTTGLRTLTIEAVDAGGLRATGTLQVDVFNPPPAVFASVASQNLRQSAPPPGYLVPLNLNLGARDPVDGNLDCSLITVTVDAPDTVTREGDAGSCQAVVHFYQQGQRRLTAVAHDQDGISSTPRTYMLNVSEPPQFPPPQFTEGILVNGSPRASGWHASCEPQDGWLFSASATVAPGMPLTYTWRLRHDMIPGSSWPLVSQESGGSSSVRFARPPNPVPGVSESLHGGPWQIDVIVSNGETEISRSMLFSWYPGPCVN